MNHPCLVLHIVTGKPLTFEHEMEGFQHIST